MSIEFPSKKNFTCGKLRKEFTSLINPLAPGYPTLDLLSLHTVLGSSSNKVCYEIMNWHTHNSKFTMNTGERQQII